MVGVTTRGRLYDTQPSDHLVRHRRMVFASGPSQAGKTMTSRAYAGMVIAWDNLDDRRQIFAAPANEASNLRSKELRGLGIAKPFGHSSGFCTRTSTLMGGVAPGGSPG